MGRHLVASQTQPNTIGQSPKQPALLIFFWAKLDLGYVLFSSTLNHCMVLLLSSSYIVLVLSNTLFCSHISNSTPFFFFSCICFSLVKPFVLCSGHSFREVTYLHFPFSTYQEPFHYKVVSSHIFKSRKLPQVIYVTSSKISLIFFFYVWKNWINFWGDTNSNKTIVNWYNIMHICCCR